MIEPEKIQDVLSDEQKKFIIDNYKTMDLSTLSRKVWSDNAADARSLRCKAVKEFLVSNNLDFTKLNNRPKSTGPLELTQEQKDFITQNSENGVKALDITRLLFQNPNLTPLSKEFRAISAFIKSLDPEDYDRNEEVVESKIYKPPLTLIHLIARINQYLPTSTGEDLYNANSLKTYEEKCIKMLMSYLKAPAFGYQATQFEKAVDRELFESSFVRFCYDKPDLTAEEIHQYISLSAEIVNTAQIERTIQKLDANINNWLSGEDVEKKKMSLTLVELINAARGKWESAKERQKKLLAELTESRSVRLKNRLDQNASILNLVEAFQREKDRKELIELAEMEKKADMVETDKLVNMDQVTALIAGMTYKELTH